MPCCLTNFHHIRPRYEVDQEVLLEWIASTHAQAAVLRRIAITKKFTKRSRGKSHGSGGSWAIEKKGIQIRMY